MPERTASAAGIRLKAMREAKGISLHDIAHVTKICTRTLGAVERGDFAKLPGGIYTRAVIRSYAASVELDPDTVLDEFMRDCPSDIEPVPTLVPEPGPARRTESLLATLASCIAPLLRTMTVLLALGAALTAGYVALSWNATPPLLPSSSVDLLAASGLHAAPRAPRVTPVSRMLDGDGDAAQPASPLLSALQSDSGSRGALR